MQLLFVGAVKLDLCCLVNVLASYAPYGIAIIVAALDDVVILVGGVLVVVGHSHIITSLFSNDVSKIYSRVYFYRHTSIGSTIITTVVVMVAIFAVGIYLQLKKITLPSTTGVPGTYHRIQTDLIVRSREGPQTRKSKYKKSSTRTAEST